MGFDAFPRLRLVIAGIAEPPAGQTWAGTIALPLALPTWLTRDLRSLAFLGVGHDSWSAFS